MDRLDHTTSRKVPHGKWSGYVSLNPGERIEISMRPIRLQNGVNWNYYRSVEFFSPWSTAAMASKVLVKRLMREFSVDVVKAAVLFGIQKLGYDQLTE